MMRIEADVPIVKKLNAEKLHINGDCGCSIAANPNNCIFQPFLDGWEFQPDVGNGQKRGEVFTPRFIVEDMIQKIGLIPTAALKDFNYNTISEEDKQKIIEAKVLEPAVGTGNYISTILWHKLEYACSSALDIRTNTLDLPKYFKNFFKAVSSIYAFDVDSGNVMVTKMRLLGGKFGHNPELKKVLKDEETLKQWVRHYRESLQLESLEETNDETIRKVLNQSFEDASENWGKFLEDSEEGVISYLFKKHTGSEIPDAVYDHCDFVLNFNNNLKTFNGIKEEDTVEKDFICRGWKDVNWVWWDYTATDKLISIGVTDIPLALQLKQGELDELEEKAETFKNLHTIQEVDGSLINGLVWDSTISKKEYARMLRNISKVSQIVEELGEGVREYGGEGSGDFLGCVRVAL